MVKFVAVYFILVLIHFFSDWIFQSETEALRKHKCAATRSKHCAIYTAFFLPFLAWKAGCVADIIVVSFWIFWTHWIEDTYYLVLLWAKYVRKAKEFRSREVFDPAQGLVVHIVPENDVSAFKEFVSAPLGLILAIVVDQLVHIVSLAPVAWYIARLS